MKPHEKSKYVYHKHYDQEQTCLHITFIGYNKRLNVNYLMKLLIVDSFFFFLTLVSTHFSVSQKLASTPNVLKDTTDKNRQCTVSFPYKA